MGLFQIQEIQVQSFGKRQEKIQYGQEPRWLRVLYKFLKDKFTNLMNYDDLKECRDIIRQWELADVPLKGQCTRFDRKQVHMIPKLDRFLFSLEWEMLNLFSLVKGLARLVYDSIKRTFKFGNMWLTKGTEDTITNES